MYKTIKPLATGLIKKQIEKAVRDALITGLEYIDGQLVAVRDRMETVKQTEGHTRTDVLKEVCLPILEFLDAHSFLSSYSKTRKAKSNRKRRKKSRHNSRLWPISETQFWRLWDIRGDGSI